jgi:hypothetical protein
VEPVRRVLGLALIQKNGDLWREVVAMEEILMDLRSKVSCGADPLRWPTRASSCDSTLCTSDTSRRKDRQMTSLHPHCLHHTVLCLQSDSEMVEPTSQPSITAFSQGFERAALEDEIRLLLQGLEQSSRESS